MSLFSSITRAVRSVFTHPKPATKPVVKEPPRHTNYVAARAIGTSANGSCFVAAKPPKCTGNI